MRLEYTRRAVPDSAQVEDNRAIFEMRSRWFRPQPPVPQSQYLWHDQPALGTSVSLSLAPDTGNVYRNRVGAIVDNDRLPGDLTERGQEEPNGAVLAEKEHPLENQSPGMDSPLGPFGLIG